MEDKRPTMGMARYATLRFRRMTLKSQPLFTAKSLAGKQEEATMVDDAEATRKSVTDNGGKIVHSARMDSGEVILHFTDPAGNIMGIYQEAN